MGALVGIPAGNDNDIVVSSDSDILELYWDKATGVIKGKKSDGNVLDFETGTSFLKQISISLSSAEVLNLFTVPKELVPAPGAGKAIVIIEASMQSIFGTVPYATNLQFNIITDTADREQMFDGDILISTVSRVIKSKVSGAPLTPSETEVIEDKALVIEVDAGNPTAGDSSFVINITYRVINV